MTGVLYDYDISLIKRIFDSISPSEVVFSDRFVFMKSSYCCARIECKDLKIDEQISVEAGNIDKFLSVASASYFVYFSDGKLVFRSEDEKIECPVSSGVRIDFDDVFEVSGREVNDSYFGLLTYMSQFSADYVVNPLLLNVLCKKDKIFAGTDSFLVRAFLPEDIGNFAVFYKVLKAFDWVREVSSFQICDTFLKICLPGVVIVLFLLEQEKVSDFNVLFDDLKLSSFGVECFLDKLAVKSVVKFAERGDVIEIFSVGTDLVARVVSDNVSFERKIGRKEGQDLSVRMDFRDFKMLVMDVDHFLTDGQKIYASTVFEGVKIEIISVFMV
ncbi:MAG: hypothetical protein QXT86_12765 [Archaeoglobaceae archaeon]